MPGGSLEQNGDQVRIETADGHTYVAGGQVKLPDGFPDDVPQPSKTLEAAMKMPQGFMVGFVCSGTQAEEFEKLQTSFKAQGWEETMAMQIGNGGVLAFTKDENSRHVQAAVGESKGKTVVNLTISKR